MNVFLIIFSNSVIGFGNCVQQKIKSKNELYRDARLAKYENEHYDDYISNMRIYEAWTEVNPEKTLELCKQHLSKICPRENQYVKSMSLEFVNLQYIRTEKKKRKVPRISALFCETFPPIHNRKFFGFARAPNTRCVYLLRSLIKSSKNFAITLQICEHHTYLDLRNDLKGIYRSFTAHVTRNEDKPASIEKFEIDHSQAFLTNPVLYQTWPELQKGIIMKKYCKVFFKKIFPKSQLDSNPSLESVFLGYTSFNYEQDISVAALFCNPSKSVYHDLQRLIRAPSSGTNICVFFIKHMYKGRQLVNYCYKISKKVCADRIDGINHN